MQVSTSLVAKRGEGEMNDLMGPADISGVSGRSEGVLGVGGRGVDVRVARMCGPSWAGRCDLMCVRDEKNMRAKG